MVKSFLRGLIYLWKDKWTLISRVLIPLLVTLLIMSSILGFISKGIDNRMQSIPSVGVFSNGIPTDLKELFSSRKDIKIVQLEKAEDARFPDEIDSIDIGVILNSIDESNQAEAKLDVEIYYNSASDFIAHAKVKAVLNDYNDLLLSRRSDGISLPTEQLHPVKINEKNSYSPFSLVINNTASAIALMMIMFGFLACIYPAIENAAIHLGKNAFSFLGRLGSTVMIGLLMSFMTFHFLKWSLDLNKAVSPILMNSYKAMATPSKMLLSFLFLLPCLIFFASTLTWVAMAGRNFKGAQNSIQPIKLIVLFLLIWAFLPSLELSWKIAWVPVLSTAVTIRDLLSGIPVSNMMLVSVGFLVGYSILALFACKRYLY